jgi:hypothetical protein
MPLKRPGFINTGWPEGISFGRNHFRQSDRPESPVIIELFILKLNKRRADQSLCEKSQWKYDFLEKSSI